MKVQKAVWQHTLRIAVGTLALGAVMNVIYALLRSWSTSVLLGTLFGAVFAVLNTFVMGLGVQKAANAARENTAKGIIQMSYGLRMLAFVALPIVAAAGLKLDVLATALTALFPRITILFLQLFGFYKQDKPEEVNTGT